VSEYNPKDLQIWQRLFERVPPEWKAAPPSRAMEACLAFFIEKGVRTVLDVGCGVGRWAMYLARHDLRVKGVDFSENAVRFAKEWAEEEGLDVVFDCNPLTETAFPGEKFEGVVAGNCRGEVAAFRGSDGEPRWKLNVKDCVRSIGNSGNSLFVGVQEGTVYAFVLSDKL